MIALVIAVLAGSSLAALTPDACRARVHAGDRAAVAAALQATIDDDATSTDAPMLRRTATILTIPQVRRPVRVRPHPTIRSGQTPAKPATVQLSPPITSAVRRAAHIGDAAFPVTTNHGPAGAPISVTQPAPDPYKVGPQSVLLDLNGNGIEIAAPDRSSTFLGSGSDGRQHRTGWAGTGDGVLICAAGNDGLIREKREHVFTEWGPTAKDDMAALRSRFDSNNTGRRTSADAEFSKFKVKVTGADGSRLAGALARLAQVLGACPQDPGTWSALGSEFANFGAKDMMRRDTAVAV